MDFETIMYKKEGGRGIVVFNRPDKLNALNRKVFEELTIICLEMEKDPEVKVGCSSRRRGDTKTSPVDRHDQGPGTCFSGRLH